MAATSDSGSWKSDDRDRLASTMDKLAAIQMDLRRLCDRRKPPGPTPPQKTVAEACDILESAVADLRQVILHLDDISQTARSG